MRRPSRAVACLAVTQTVGYGVLYYAFAVFITPMMAQLHASRTAVTGALAASVLAEAVAAVPVGRWVDRHDGASLMCAGSVVESVLLAAWAGTDNLLCLYAVWIGIGAVSAAVLYETAFAVLVPRLKDPAARASAVLAVTLTAGFASTLFIPGPAFLIDLTGWRRAALALAVLHALVAIPLHMRLRGERTNGHGGSDSDSDDDGRVADSGEIGAVSLAGPPNTTPEPLSAFRDPAFWLFAFAFTTNSAAVYSAAVLLPTLLHDLGHPATFSTTVTGLLGVSSVTGRLLGTASRRRVPTAVPAAILFALQTAGAALLPLLGRGTPGCACCVICLGLGSGVGSLARPLIQVERFGTNRYATVSSAWTLPATAAKSIAPVLLTTLLLNAGPDRALAAIAGCAALSALCLPAADLLAVRRAARTASVA